MKLCSICQDNEADIDIDMCAECDAIDKELNDEVQAEHDRLIKGVTSTE